MSDERGSAIHRAAAQGYGAEADTYVTGRPDYPAAVTGWLAADLGLGPGRRVLDLGSGTGKFLPILRATGASVVAVEPVDAMRARIAGAHPEVEALAGTAEAIPLDAASLDAVVCAQSFHWFATAAALTEIARVLRPGGRLGLIWNVRDETVPWVAALSRITDPHEGGAPRYRTGVAGPVSRAGFRAAARAALAARAQRHARGRDPRPHALGQLHRGASQRRARPRRRGGAGPHRRHARTRRPSDARLPLRDDGLQQRARRTASRSAYLFSSTLIGSVRWLAGGSLVRLAPPSRCTLTSCGAPGPPTARPPSVLCVGTVPEASSRQVTIST